MIKFLPENHVYVWEDTGEVCPGVTTILKPLNDFSGIPEAVLSAKASLGTWVHKATELIDQFELNWDTVPEDRIGYCRAYERWLDEVGPVITGSEQQVWSIKHRFAGTFDRTAKIEGKSWLIDIKTTAAINKPIGPQLAAYKEALKESKGIEVDGRAALQLKPDGTYRFVPFTDRFDWSVFLSCLTIHKFKELNKCH